MRMTEQIVFETGEQAIWLTCTNKSYDLAISLDHSGVPGRFHHVTFAVDSREDVLRAADIALENGVYIETGPHKHAIQQTFFLYLVRTGRQPRRSRQRRRAADPRTGLENHRLE